MQTYILLTCNPGHEKEVITHLRSIKGVLEVSGIWGEYDIFLKVEHDAEFGLDRFVEILRKIENITSTYTMPILFGQGELSMIRKIKKLVASN
ncbi:AsnC family transcriptional regulator [Nitrosarchaeum sp.]|nr:AsnC family transcriptional regulator [Nitrosarchaeum sp.]